MKVDAQVQKNGKEKQLFMLRNISIWLDTYDDIFSDFDPRPYSERTLSDDFLVEVRKVCRESDETIHELKLLIPADKRNIPDEEIITKRLNSLFKKGHRKYLEQNKYVLRKGLLFIFTGFLLLLAASYLSAMKSGMLSINVLLVICEPSGWFLVWSGFDSLFYTSKQSKTEFEFYNKLSKSHISFFPI